MKIVITGTGRAGTTFLVSLFTCLGFNTGYTKQEIADFYATIDSKPARAGLEGGLVKEANIIKSPSYIKQIKEIKDKLGHIDRIYVPIRSIEKVVKSRASCQAIAGTNEPVDGGWINGADTEQELKERLLENFHQFCLDVSEIDTVVEFIHFPRMIEDPKYLYSRLNYCMKRKDIGYSEFLEMFGQVRQSKLIRFW